MKTETITLSYQEKLPELALAVGFFDGLHIGHMTLLKEALNSANLEPAILSFEPDFKAKIFHTLPELLLSEKEKESALSWLGFKYCFLLKSEESVISSDPNDFLTLILNMNVKKLIVGKDFTFGKFGKGKIELLKKLENQGVEVIVKDLIELSNEKVASSLIKNTIKNGDIEKANQLLGYPFYLVNPVIHGLQNGQKIGYPTANQEYPVEKVKLKDGVYKTRTTIDGKSYPSMTNIGNHPTINPLDNSIIETYVIGYSGDLYGKEIKVSFHKFLREQVKFSSLEALKCQLDKDIEACK